MSNVQLLHKPTGIRVNCQETRSLELNRRFARRILVEKACLTSWTGRVQFANVMKFSWIGFRILDCLKANCREQNNAKESVGDARRQRKKPRGRKPVEP